MTSTGLQRIRSGHKSTSELIREFRSKRRDIRKPVVDYAAQFGYSEDQVTEWEGRLRRKQLDPDKPLIVNVPSREYFLQHTTEWYAEVNGAIYDYVTERRAASQPVTFLYLYVHLRHEGYKQTLTRTFDFLKNKCLLTHEEQNANADQQKIPGSSNSSSSNSSA
ncbi:MAG TPA: hypothetical protein VJJ76_02480 [archaeon]|nr:hypothetical protein [archaeon]